MVWVEFSRPFNFVPDAAPMSSVMYRAGWSGKVTRECAKKAIAAGAATESGNPRHADSRDDEEARSVEAQNEGLAASGEDGTHAGG